MSAIQKAFSAMQQALPLAKGNAGEDDSTILDADIYEDLSEAIQALQSLEGEAVAEDVAHLIFFEDRGRQQEVFTGHGARDAARNRYDQISSNWNAHLFVCIDHNSKLDRSPTAHTTPQPPAVPDDQWLVYNLRESLKFQERRSERLSELLEKASDYKDYLENPEESPVWIWQGDGEDRPDSMVNSLTVVIRADQLRALVDKAKNDAVRDGFVRVPPGVIRDAVSDLKEVQMRLNQSGAYTDPQTTVRICLDRTLEALLTAAQQGDGNE